MTWTVSLYRRDRRLTLWTRSEHAHGEHEGNSVGEMVDDIYLSSRRSRRGVLYGIRAQVAVFLPAHWIAFSTSCSPEARRPYRPRVPDLISILCL